MVRTLYLPYSIDKNVNYLYLFRLMRLAEYNTETHCFDCLQYKSIAALAQESDIKPSTLKRILAQEGTYKDYAFYFSLDAKRKAIQIHNNFIGKTGTPYIILRQEEVSFLLAQNDNLLCKYLIYIKYNCGRTKNINQDFTAKQFLNACGYSAKSASMLNTISGYNALLCRHDFIRISHERDSLGHLRNTYYYSDFLMD